MPAGGSPDFTWDSDKQGMAALSAAADLKIKVPVAECKFCDRSFFRHDPNIFSVLL